jgi:CubicO group peptidase (beta-lactamase class C family)
MGAIGVHRGLSRLIEGRQTTGGPLPCQAGEGPRAKQDAREEFNFDRRPYLSAEELRADLRLPLAIEANARFSKHGLGLLVLLIESVTGEPYRQFIKRESDASLS